MAGIFKAYDIRGIYGQSLTEDTAFKIGRAVATFLKCQTMVVGRDMRPHSGPLSQALIDGLLFQGVDVIDLGLCSTPMCYFATGRLEAHGSVMITASHNPAEWNGMKLTREQAIPISGATGIQDIEQIVNQSAFAPTRSRGHLSTYDILPEYAAHVRRLARLQKPIHVAADMANAMGVYEARVFEGLLKVTPLFDTLDGTFPNHEANPLKPETLRWLQATIRQGSFDFGVAFDGDADRVGFLDECGEIIPMDLITALIARELLTGTKGTVLYDLRSSWVVREVIEAHGGTPLMCRVGHAFIKQQMRDTNALFAGELSGHYYFRDNFFTESSAMATICVANIVSRADRPLSQLVAPLRKYFASGEINSKVRDQAAVLARLKEKYRNGKIATLDGVTVEYPDWWFNVRGSNTEPLIRLNLEARTRGLMEQKRDEVLAEIRRDADDQQVVTE